MLHMLYLLNHFVIKIVVIQHYFFIYLEIYQLNIDYVLEQHWRNYQQIMRMHFQTHELKLNYRNEIKNEKNSVDKIVINQKLLLKRQRQIQDNHNAEENNNNNLGQHLNRRKLVLESDVCACL
jgi:hypothetical protein